MGFYEALEVIGRLLEEGKEQQVVIGLKDGYPWAKYRSRIVEATQFYALSVAFGWTPEYIEGMDVNHRLMYLSLLRGKSSAGEKHG